MNDIRAVTFLLDIDPLLYGGLMVVAVIIEALYYQEVAGFTPASSVLLSLLANLASGVMGLAVYAMIRPFPIEGTVDWPNFGLDILPLALGWGVAMVTSAMIKWVAFMGFKIQAPKLWMACWYGTLAGSVVLALGFKITYESGGGSYPAVLYLFLEPTGIILPIAALGFALLVWRIGKLPVE